MKLLRLSIAKLMAFVAVIAIDFALVVRIASHDRMTIWPAAGTFLMVNFLALGLIRRISRHTERCSFLVGFEVAGFGAVLVWLTCFYWFPGDRMLDVIYFFGQPINRMAAAIFEDRLGDWYSRPEWITYNFDILPAFARIPLVLASVLFVTAPITLFQLLFALAGGLLARRIAK